MCKIIDNNLPIDFDFSSKTVAELKLYSVWFFENKNERINQLLELININNNNKPIILDFNISSLVPLGKWLVKNVKVEKLSEVEFIAKRNSIPSYIELNDWDLSIKTRSILVDIGIYFGEVVIKNNSGCEWKQYFSKIKDDVDNGHLVINIGKDRMNPIWLLYIIGLKIADGNENNEILLNLYETWCS